VRILNRWSDWRGVVNDNKAVERQLEELLRHNRAMEGQGLHLVLYKYGQELYLGPWTGCDNKEKKRRKNIKNACR